jgi:putative cardiolipin synthase
MPPEEDIEKRYQTFRDYIAEQVNSPYMQALRNSDLTKRVRRDQVKFIWGEARIVSDQPEKLLNDKDASTYHLAPQLRPFFREVRDELMIISPYFVPARSGTDFLMQLADSGIRVRILTNSLGSNDVPIVHSAYAKYRKDLLRSGVELYEVSKVLSREQRRQKSRLGQSSSASLHAKSFVFDRDHVFIGSLNLDPRSVYENTEIGVVLDSVEIANDMAGWFEKFVAENAYRLELTKNNNGVEQIVWYGTENGVETTYHVEPHTNFSTRFSNGLTGLLPIESQL